MTETTQDASPAPDAVPVSQETDSSPEAVATETTAAADTSPKEQDVISPVQRRIDKLTWEKNEWARRYAELEARNAPKEPEKPRVEAPPTLAQFEYDEAKYQAALVEWTRAEAEKAAVTAFQREREAEQQRSRVTTFKQREQDFISKTPDYQEKVYDPTLPISPAMVELIAESPDGPVLAYHLANNPDLCRQIASLPPLVAAREMGRLEQKLQKPVAPVVSKAPAPPPRVEAVDPDVKKSLDDPNLSDKEWEAIRRRQIAQRRNR